VVQAIWGSAAWISHGIEELPLTGSACRGTEGFQEFAGDF